MPPPVKRDLGGQLGDILERIVALENRSRPAPLPAGMLRIFAGTETPTGWLEAAGGFYEPEDYPDLYKAFGTTYGGTATAPLLPDARGRALVGVDPSQAEFDAIGKTGGAKTHTLTATEMPTHSHATTTDTSAKALSTTTSGAEAFSATGTNNYRRTAKLSDNVTGNAGSGTAHNNLQPYLVVRLLIKT